MTSTREKAADIARKEHEEPKWDRCATMAQVGAAIAAKIEALESDPMADTREKADAELRERIEAIIDADDQEPTDTRRLAGRIASFIAAREASLRDDYEGVLADKRQLVRELDVALHGEAGVAKQASLCDLIEPAKALRAEIERLSAALAEATAANGERAQTTIDKIASITSAREASLRAERDQAVRALEGSGWTLTPGAAEWRPPLGKRPDFEQIDELRAEIAELRSDLHAAHDMLIEWENVSSFCVPASVLAATRAELAEARARAFDEAAQIAEDFKLNLEDDRTGQKQIAAAIRARAALEAKQ